MYAKRHSPYHLSFTEDVSLRIQPTDGKFWESCSRGSCHHSPCEFSDIPHAGQGRGVAQTAGAPQDPIGQVVEGEDEETIDEEINAEYPPSPRVRDKDNRQREAPQPQEPTLTEAMANQIQLLQQLVENVTQNRETPKEGLRKIIESFIKLKAPTFDHSEDPLEAEDWLRVIEKKLDLTACTDEECIALVSEQSA